MLFITSALAIKAAKYKEKKENLGPYEFKLYRLLIDSAGFVKMKARVTSVLRLRVEF